MACIRTGRDTPDKQRSATKWAWGGGLQQVRGQRVAVTELTHFVRRKLKAGNVRSNRECGLHDFSYRGSCIMTWPNRYGTRTQRCRCEHTPPPGSTRTPNVGELLLDLLTAEAVTKTREGMCGQNCPEPPGQRTQSQWHYSAAPVLPEAYGAPWGHVCWLLLGANATFYNLSGGDLTQQPASGGPRPCIADTGLGDAHMRLLQEATEVGLRRPPRVSGDGPSSSTPSCLSPCHHRLVLPFRLLT